MRNKSTAKGQKQSTAPPLPLEIWRIICEQFTDDKLRPRGTTITEASVSYEDYWDRWMTARLALMALCRVSKGIAEMAQAARFKCYHMDWRLDRKWFLMYLRSVMDSPRLAGCTKELILRETVYQSMIEGGKDLLAEKAEVAATYKRLAAHIGVDTCLFPFNFAELEPRTGPIPARLPGLLLLAIPLLSNLTALSVETGPNHTRPFELLEKLHASRVIEPFWRVQDLTIEFPGHWMGGVTDLTRLAPLLALTPNLTTLRLRACPGFAHMADEDYVDAARRRMPPGLTALEVRDSYFNDETVGGLLGCCPSAGLARFTYQSVQWTLPSATAGREVTPRQLVQRLLAHSPNTLREVELDYSRPGRQEYDHGDSAEYEKKLTRAEFAGFPALRTMVHLTKEDWVPPEY